MSALTWRGWLTATVVLGTSTLASGSVETAPNAGDIVAAAKATIEKLTRQPARWKVHCEIAPQQSMVMEVVLAQGKRATVMVFEHDGRREVMARLIETNSQWFLESLGKRTRWRPYEAVFELPGGYVYRSFSDPMLLTDKSVISGAHFETRDARVDTFRVPLIASQRRIIEQTLAGIAQSTATDQLAEQEKRLRELLTKGQPIQIDEATGIIVRRQVNNIPVVVDEFAWLNAVPEGTFDTAGQEWEDHTGAWDTPTNWAMVVGNPNAVKLALGTDTDGHLLNLATGEVRRLPYEGASVIPLCFLPDRTTVLIAGYDTSLGFDLLKLNLKTGENTMIGKSGLAGGVALAASRAPNGREVAVIYAFGGSEMLQFQLRLLDLTDGKLTDLGKPAKVGGPIDWLPDSDGLILKRFLPAPTPDGIEARVIVRVNRDGSLVDLLPGDMPVVLREAKRILFERDNLWFSCNFEGKDVRPFGDGLKGAQFPSVSPDEKSVLFARYAGDSLLSRNTSCFVLQQAAIWSVLRHGQSIQGHPDQDRTSRAHRVDAQRQVHGGKVYPRPRAVVVRCRRVGRTMEGGGCGSGAGDHGAHDRAPQAAFCGGGAGGGAGAQTAAQTARGDL